jgi:hypothetical protein
VTKNVTAKDWTSIIQAWNDGSYRTWAQALAISGLLALGHYLPSIQPMHLVYPRPDTETSASARHHWAFLGSTPMLYDIPIDLIGGSYPHVPVLMGDSNPPGMVIVMPDYSAGPPYVSPRLQWTPTEEWSGTVWIRWYSQEFSTDSTQFIDQQFSLATSNDVANGGVFAFVSIDGGLSTNTGGYGSPLDDMPTVFGTTYAAAPVIHSVAMAGKICVLMPSTEGKAYTLPLYTDGFGNGSYFEVHNANKPIALIGFPGAAKPKISIALATLSAVVTDTQASDFFMSWLNPDGYNTGVDNFRFCSIGGSGDFRITLDNIEWTNSGWGTVGNENCSILEAGNFAGLRQYIYCNACSETNRQPGTPANNFAGPDLYSCQYSLVQGYSINDPSFTGDSGAFLKVDDENCEIRGCYYNVSDILFACSFGESADVGYTTNDSTYNLMIGVNVIGIPKLNSNLAGPQTTLRAARNTLITAVGTGFFTGTPATGAGPWVIEANAVQGPNVVLPADNAAISTSGNQVVTDSSLLDETTGLLVDSANVGTLGAQIA